MPRIWTASVAFALLALVSLSVQAQDACVADCQGQNLDDQALARCILDCAGSGELQYTKKSCCAVQTKFVGFCSSTTLLKPASEDDEIDCAMVCKPTNCTYSNAATEAAQCVSACVSLTDEDACAAYLNKC